MRSMRLIFLALASCAAIQANAGPYEKKVRPPVCSVTTIAEISARIGEEINGKFVPGDPKEVGTAIRYANGVGGVSYDYVPAISERSRVGDRVRLCLVSRYVGCPKGDDRGKIYVAVNLRTHEKWSLPDAQHICGGA